MADPVAPGGGSRPPRRPREPRPIHGRVTDMRRLRRILRILVQQPIFNSMRLGIERAQEAARLLRELDNVAFAPQLDNQRIETELLALFDAVAAWHRARLIDTFRRALGIDITGYLSQTGVQSTLAAAVQANVDLISTIPEHAHAGLARRLRQFLQTDPFNQQALRRLLATQYGVTSSRLDLISVDQTNKIIGKLTEIRHQEAGVNSYTWLTSRDGRVRPTHAANEGRRVYWNAPPADTGHVGQDIRCRCVAVPWVPGVSDRRRR